jgi:RHS repeat-associated protein
VTSIDSGRQLNGVVCASAAECVAVDDDGHEISYGSSGWASPKDVDGTNSIQGVGSPNTFYFWLADDEGKVVTDDWASADTQMIWDSTGNEPVIASDNEYDYIYGPDDEPVEQIGNFEPHLPSPGFLTYVTADSTWVVTKQTGQMDYWSYDAFGNLAQGTPESAFGYAGQYTDTGSNPSGFTNMRARWYDPAIGTFTSLDPDFSATDAAYAYSAADPVNHVDPSGLEVEPEIVSGEGDNPANNSPPGDGGSGSPSSSAATSSQEIILAQDEATAQQIAHAEDPNIYDTQQYLTDYQQALDALEDPTEVCNAPAGADEVARAAQAAEGEGTAASIGVSGAAGEFDVDELAQLTYQHIGEGDIAGRPTLDEIEAALRNATPTRLEDQNAVEFDYKGVRVIVNEDVPTRSTA